MEKVVLDCEACIGCGACVGCAPETFDFEAGISKVIDETVTDAAREAVTCCPVEAISIVTEEAEEELQQAA